MRCEEQLFTNDFTSSSQNIQEDFRNSVRLHCDKQNLYDIVLIFDISVCIFTPFLGGLYCPSYLQPLVALR